ncbi:Uncharacterised protein [Mycobacteroides abscessus]|nr:Uncharacterised protein [Mycobacteroides abscessus]
MLVVARHARVEPEARDEHAAAVDAHRVRAQREMVDAAATGDLERCGSLADDRARLLRVDDPAGDDLAQRDARVALGHDVGHAVLGPDVEHPREARVDDERRASCGVERLGDVRAGDDREPHRSVEDLVVGRPCRDVRQVGRELLVEPVARDEQRSWGHAVHRTSSVWDSWSRPHGTRARIAPVSPDTRTSDVSRHRRTRRLTRPTSGPASWSSSRTRMSLRPPA